MNGLRDAFFYQKLYSLHGYKNLTFPTKAGEKMSEGNINTSKCLQTMDFVWKTKINAHKKTYRICIRISCIKTYCHHQYVP